MVADFNKDFKLYEVVQTCHMKNHTLTEHELETKQFTAALPQMRESELARLVDMVETLAQELNRISLHNSESIAAAVAAQRLIKLWNKELQRIIKTKRENDVT